MSAVLEFLPEAKCDADEATRFYERRVPGLGARFRAEVESVCAAISFGSRFCGASAAVAITASTSPDFLTTSHTSSATNAFWSLPLDTPAVTPTIGSGANSESERTPNHALQRTGAAELGVVRR